MENALPHKFIVIEGNIGAGKTTLSQLVARDYGCRLILEQFSDNPFLPLFYDNPERYAFSVELFFMTERHKQLQDELKQTNLFQQGVVADYFFVKTLLFAKTTCRKRNTASSSASSTFSTPIFPNPTCSSTCTAP